MGCKRAGQIAGGDDLVKVVRKGHDFPTRTVRSFDTPPSTETRRFTRSAFFIGSFMSVVLVVGMEKHDDGTETTLTVAPD